MNYRIYHLDLTVHRYPSASGGHWSSPELADLADGKITEEECRRLYKIRRDTGEAYVPLRAPSDAIRQMFLCARLEVDRRPKAA